MQAQQQQPRTSSQSAETHHALRQGKKGSWLGPHHVSGNSRRINIHNTCSCSHAVRTTLAAKT
eukprot:1157605-Pelagomonas_calceolata.AAC.3